ncbi:hypothetical protein ACFV4F_26425 [Kitasatospora sp. NPDC059722]|uniref:hypothetical protein n=1 Tax=unclassified Kitasatospora TaxID=2633591 RepID=UPI003668FE08
MIVEVDLYSGRPNPRFPLEPAAAGELARRIEALAPAGAGARPRDGLGYRGLRVGTGADDDVTGIVVSGGLVTLHDPDGPPRRLRDPGRQLERWLLDQGAGNLDPEVLATVRQDLAR